jgi:hypothetical protein
MATKKPFIVKHGLEITGNTTITGSFLPAANNVYDLGSEGMVWRDVYIGPGSLYVNGQKVIEDNSDTIIVRADPDQSLTIKTEGTGETTLQSAGGVNITSTGSADIQITAGGNIEMKSPVQIQTGNRITDSAGTNVEYGDNIEMNGNKITGLGAPVSDTDASTKKYVDDEVAALVNGAPETLDTLNELAQALGDADALTTLTTNIGQKLGATASVTLTGDVSGSASFSANAVSITTTIADDSHNHVISNVDGLQDALDAKQSVVTERAALANTNAYIATKLDSSSYTAADVLSKITTVDGATSGLDADLLDGQHGSYYRSWDNATNKPSPTVTLSGDVSGSATLTELAGATIVTTIADDSHNHVIGNVDGLQDALDAKLAASSYTATDVLTKIKTVDGAGSGLDADLLDGQSGSYYTNYADAAVSALVDSAPATLDTLNELAAALGDDANFASTLTTNLGQKLGATASVTLTGDVSGSGSFSSNAVSIAVTVADDSHNHTIANVDGLQTALNAKLAASSYTAADVLSKIKTVDGSGSGLDADKLDGQSSAYYAVAATENARLANTNAYIATKLASSHDMSLTLSGDASGSATFTNMGNATLSVSVGNDSHNHSSSSGNFTVGGDLTVSGGDIVLSGTGRIQGVDTVSSATDAANKSYVDTAISNLIGGAPGALDTLNELAAAINDDASYASSITTALAGKLNTTHDMSLTLSGDVSGSATFTNMGNATLSVTVADDSHAHVIGNVDGLQAALDAKADDSTTITAGTGLNGGGTIGSNRTINVNSDLRAWGTGTDVYWGNTHDYVFADASHGLRFYTAGAEEMRLTDGGVLHVDADVVAYSTTVSDERLKENVEVVSDAISKVQQLRGVTFNYKKDGRASAGVIAQEVEKVLPQAVTEMELPFKSDDGQEYKTVQYDALHALLIEAVKDLQAQIDELKK